MKIADRTARDYLWYIYGYVQSRKTMTEDDVKGLEIAIDNALERIYEFEREEPDGS